MTPIQLGLSVIASIIPIGSAILFFIFSERLFAWLEPVAEKWKNLRGKSTMVEEKGSGVKRRENEAIYHRPSHLMQPSALRETC